jgi:hypothetical protein
MDKPTCRSCHAPGEYRYPDHICLGCVHMTQALADQGVRFNLESTGIWRINTPNHEYYLHLAPSSLVSLERGYARTFTADLGTIVATLQLNLDAEGR